MGLQSRNTNPVTTLAPQLHHPLQGSGSRLSSSNLQLFAEPASPPSPVRRVSRPSAVPFLPLAGDAE